MERQPFSINVPIQPGTALFFDLENHTMSIRFKGEECRFFPMDDDKLTIRKSWGPADIGHICYMLAVMHGLRLKEAHDFKPPIFVYIFSAK